MTTRAFVAALGLLVSLLVGGVSAPAQAAAGCKPYCSKATIHTANRLDGKGHRGWLATELDSNGYRGKRWAEIDRIPPRHGKRYVGIIQVPKQNAAKARRALAGSWFAKRGNLFVLPLVTQYDTRGASGAKYKTTARWAAKRLGKGWKVVAP